MATKKLQILDSLIKQAENADTLDGKHADEFATSDHNHSDMYYTKNEIDNLELITLEDIDAICGTTIQIASTSGVTF